jgi:hypothetical protein
VGREERASTPGRRPRSARHELTGSQGWRNLRCLRQAMSDSIPSVYQLLLLLDVRGQGRRNERRRRCCARAAVQPSAVRARREAESAELLSDGWNGLPTSSTSLLPDSMQHRRFGVFPGVARSSISKGAQCCKTDACMRLVSATDVALQFAG